MTVRRRVEARPELADRLEAGRLGADRGKRHQHHRLVVEIGGLELAQHVGQVFFDVAERRAGEHLGRVLDGHGLEAQGRIGLDARLELERGERARADDAVDEQPLARLEGAHGGVGSGAELAVDIARIESGVGETPLQTLDVAALRSNLQSGHGCPLARCVPRIGSPRGL